VEDDDDITLDEFFITVDEFFIERKLREDSAAVTVSEQRCCGLHWIILSECVQTQATC
jgi:hypothetical protein